MSMKKLRNHVHRNGFDLSRRNAFTAKVGELLPVLCEEVIPGDKFKIKPEWFTRTRPLNTAAYTRVREYYDFYFIPYRLLWKGFDSFITQMDNPVSASSIKTDADSNTYLPYITAGQLYDYCSKLKEVCDKFKTTVNYYSAQNEVGLPRDTSTFKLLNYLNYGNIERMLTTDKAGRPNLALNVMPLLAYQKVYQDYYRNSQWEAAKAYTWNIDYISTRRIVNIDISSLTVYLNQSERTDSFLDLHYCNWNKDMFFGLLPKPQFGDESFAPIGINNTLSAVTSVDKTVNFDTPDAIMPDGSTVKWKTNSGRAGYLQAYYSSESEKVEQDAIIRHGHNATTSLNGTISSNGLSVLALRQAEALQKWKEISLSGSKDFRSQMQKHWGVDVGVNRSDLCQYLGGSVSNVSIGEVVNNNITSDNIADIAGKGVGSGSGSIDFESKDYGIIMCIYHALPLLDYESVGMKRFNTKVRSTDFAIPEFDSVGMQVVNNYELCYLQDIVSPAGVKPLGYAPRYIEYKTAVDEVHGGFMSYPDEFIEQQGFPAWVAPLNYARLQNIVNSSYMGQFSYPLMKVTPTVLDSIFSGTIFNSETGVYDNSLSTDQLLCNAFFDVKAVRNLDYDGLPY